MATVTHEVAHQWWYGPVGNNQNRHALSGEGMAVLSTALFLEHRSGPEAGEAYHPDVRLGYEAFVARADDRRLLPVGRVLPDRLRPWHAGLARGAG